MKNIITTYAFDASAKTIDFSAYSGFDIKRLQAVINAKNGALIYCVAVPAKGYSSFASNILTLEFDTTAMDDTDPLQIIYLDNTEGTLATQTTLAALLAKIIAAPATEAKQDAMITLLTALNGYVDGLEGFTDGIEGALQHLMEKILLHKPHLPPLIPKYQTL